MGPEINLTVIMLPKACNERRIPKGRVYRKRKDEAEAVESSANEDDATINHHGNEKYVIKRILDSMNVEVINKENVADHIKKILTLLEKNQSTSKYGSRICQ
ncbi:hypothetical protein R6Q57_005871 [Mikania cordata]